MHYTVNRIFPFTFEDGFFGKNITVFEKKVYFRLVAQNTRGVFVHIPVEQENGIDYPANYPLFTSKYSTKEEKLQVISQKPFSNDKKYDIVMYYGCKIPSKEKTMENILKLLENDSRLTAAQIASMIGRTEEEVEGAIAEYEKNGTIVAYKTLIDWDKTDREIVSAVIELKVTPQRDRGFDKFAEKLINYNEITSICLMSGSYDIQLIIEGKTLREVAQFVAMKLAPMDYITATSTSFVLKKYKDKGVIYQTPEEDERGNCPV